VPTSERTLLSDPDARARRSRLPYAPPGLRFDQLARTPLHRWRRPLVGTLVLVCAYWIFQRILGAPLTLALRWILGPNSISVALIMGLPAALLAARWVQRCPVLPLVVLEAAAQEYVFRGWLLQAFGAYLRSPWPGIVASSVLFSLIHSAAYQSLWAMAFYSLFGVVLAYLTVRTGGLEAVLALHAIYNGALILLAVASGLVNAPPAQADWAAVPWLGVMTVQAVPLAVFAALVLWVARRRNVAVITGNSDP
jgi:membrane protease YdiL (CAAX protease family)